MKRICLQIKQSSNEKGMALVVVLLVLTVISIVGLSLMGFAVNNMKMSSGESNYQSSYYIAESGANLKMNDINNNMLTYYNQALDGSTFFSNAERYMSLGTDSTYSDFDSSFSQQPSAKVRIEKVNNSNSNSATSRDYNIISVGTINNRSITVVKPFHLTWKTKSSGGSNNINVPADTAVFVDTTISLDNGATISGAIGTNSSLSGKISLNGNASIIGNSNIYVGPNADTSTMISKPSYIIVNNPIVKMSAVKTFSLPVFPTIPSYPLQSDLNIKNGNYTLTMNQDMSFSNISLDNNYTLTVDVGSNNRSIVVGNLNMINGSIKINGTGKLTIYVTGNVAMGSGSVLNTGKDVSKLIMYLKRSSVPTNPKSLSLTGSQQIYGSLFAEDANISVDNSGVLNGYFLTGGTNVSFSGNANAGSNNNLFYAPNAAFNITGSAYLAGSIVAKSLTAVGGNSITFQTVNLNNVPFISNSGSGGTTGINDILATDPVRESN